MNTIHITLQGKGGVGKSFVSSLIAQFKIENGDKVTCIDTDPINSTFSEYTAFDARHIALLEGSKVNERNFDQLMETVFESESDFVIDNGASSFIPLSNYLVENAAFEMLHEAGKKVVVHPVVTGGQALTNTLNGFDQLASQFHSQADIIVWLNEYFGEIARDGKNFEQMKTYKEHKDRVRGIITIPKKNSDTFGKDVELMLNKRLTFDEAIISDDFSLMAKQRLKMIKQDLFEKMALVI